MTVRVNVRLGTVPVEIMRVAMMCVVNMVVSVFQRIMGMCMGVPLAYV